jgi:nucleotide-binding universal stress UspA family protein
MVVESPLPVLLALSERDCPTYCVQRAADVAAALRAELRVIRVLPKSSGVMRVLLGDSRSDGDRARAALRATRLWLARTSGEEPAIGRVVVRTGRFVEQVARHVDLCGAQLIIIPADRFRVGATATSLARRTRLKVFVARQAAAGKTILAATDLAHAGFPVVRQAVQLASVLHAPVTVFHNVDPLSRDDDRDGDDQRERGAFGLRFEARLASAVRELPTAAIPVVRSELDPAFALSEETRKRDIDIVVVGVQERSRLRRWLHGSIASRVAQKAERSVVVTPLEPPALLRPAGGSQR